jgi:hypothetical protein
MSPYVVKKWQVTETSVSSTSPGILIEGRAGGFISWLLSLVEISPTVRLEINADKILFASRSNGVRKSEGG